jgi:predicted alpha/beta-fold hydrolase
MESSVSKLLANSMIALPRLLMASLMPRDYWLRASSKPHLDAIQIPSLMIQAANDPFLPEPCFPRKIAKASKSLHLEIPRHGGHVGFVSRGSEYWSETRCAEFLKEVIP